ncbi:enoyl-CoA hydratase/isomerase family protein [Pontitalea aquivivens]|uniref:enoyl-CoA hydratase/isomerase family protein n=1 Tax=Pontitalea aquivivens TaxID=3388663 RepID=UPI0039709086
MTDFTSIDLKIENGFARVTLNQPDRGNPIDGAFCRDIRVLAAQLAAMPDLRAVLITAKGRVFSVGGDIRSFSSSRENISRLVQDWTADLHSGLARLRRINAPVIVSVHGNIAGGSVSFMAFADVVLTARNIKISAAFSMIGFCADSGSTVSLSERMGVARAKRFLLLSETLTAEEAQAAGLVDFVHDAEELEAATEALAKKLANGPTRAFGKIKETMRTVNSSTLESQLEDEAQALAEIAASDDAWEGITAFGEKRAPRFTGR